MNVASEVTCWSFTWRGSPVDLSMSTPFNVYSWPTVSPLYSTVSVMVICSAGLGGLFSINGCCCANLRLAKVTVWPSSLISAWDATTDLPARAEPSKV